MRLFDRILGVCRVEVGSEYAERVLCAMLRRGLPHRLASRGENGELKFEIRRKYRDLMLEIIDKCGVSVYIIYETGLRSVIARYRRRWGIPIGIALFAFIVGAGGLFVWDVSVEPAPGIDCAVVEQRLDELGFRTGCLRFGTDLYELCNEYLAAYRDCAWISVNLIGTVAHVEARERVVKPEEEKETPCNLIAEYGGIVVSREVFEGRPTVRAGDMVPAGGLLVSGVVDDLMGGVHLCRSRGRVYAEIERTFSESVPFSEEREITLPDKRTGIGLSVFGHELRLWGKNEGVERRHEPTVGGKTLPFCIVCRYSERTEYTLRTLSPQKAKSIAEYRVSSRMKRELADAQILSVTKTCLQTEEECTVTWAVRCIADIAIPAEIAVGDTENGGDPGQS